MATGALTVGVFEILVIEWALGSEHHPLFHTSEATIRASWQYWDILEEERKGPPTKACIKAYRRLQSPPWRERHTEAK